MYDSTTHDAFPTADEQQDRVVEQFMHQISSQVYTDPQGARKLLVQLDELLGDEAAPSLLARRRLMHGNLANQELLFEDARKCFEEARDIAATAVPQLRSEIVADLVGTLLNLDAVAEAAETLDEHLRVSEMSGLAKTYHIAVREGFLHLRLGALDDALRNFAEAKRELPDLSSALAKPKDGYYAALLYAGYGRLFARGEELGRSIEAYESVIDICRRFNMRGRLPYHFLDLGRALMAADRRPEAEANFRQAIDHAGPRDKTATGAASANLGYYAFLDQDWEAAARLFDAAEYHYQTGLGPALSDLSVIAQWRARLAVEQNDRSTAEQALIRAFDLADEASDTAQLASVCTEIARFHASQGEYEEAYEYQLRYEDLQREAEAHRSAQRVSELELRYEVEEQRRESELLRLRATRLQLKALRAQMNPHFIFNALNSIQEFITSNRATEAAAHLAHFARLMRQSLDYSEREVISLEEEVDFLRNYLELSQRLRFSNRFAFELVIDEALEDDLIGLPAMLVQPYVENALEHGIRLVESGHIAVRFSSPADDEDTLLITVEDNGVGRQRAAKRPVSQGTHRSMGTAITRHRLELLNQEHGNTTAVAYHDLTHPNGAPAGTRVEVSLPIHWLA